MEFSKPMRSTILALLLSAALVGTQAQSPTDAHLEGKSYVNSYFRFSYSWPRILRPIDPASLDIIHLQNTDEFLLFTAKEGDEPYGVIVLAEKLNVPKPHSSGIKDGVDFLERVIRTFDAAGRPKILSRRQFTNATGLAFNELDYMIFGEYTSAITAQFGQFLVVFKCNAKSAPDLAEMTKSVLELETLK
jgi:hypothetical protein